MDELVASAIAHWGPCRLGTGATSTSTYTDSYTDSTGVKYSTRRTETARSATVGSASPIVPPGPGGSRAIDEAV